MYLPNKYTTWYYNIIIAGQKRNNLCGYTEKHHIIPKSLGGSNLKSNIVSLTAREHFVCHWLLTKMVYGENKIKMNCAFWRMLVKGSNVQDRYKPNSRIYESLRKKYGSSRKGIITPDSVKEKISKANKGKVAWNRGISRTPEEKLLISKNRKKTAETKIVWNKGKSHSKETLQKISEKAKTRKKYVCPHCSKESTGANYYRWHGDNCRTNVL
jgi:hypothetical protein